MTYEEIAKWWDSRSIPEKQFALSEYLAQPYDMGLVGASLLERAAINTAGTERWYKALVFAVRRTMGPVEGGSISNIRLQIQAAIARAGADERLLACYLATVGDPPQHTDFDPRLIDPASGEML